MTVLERKAKLITAILNDPDEERFAELEIKELNDSLCRQEEDFAAGRIMTIPHAQMLLKRKKVL